MVQQTEIQSELRQVSKQELSRTSKKQKKLDARIKTHEIVAAPDYIFMNSKEFTQHFTNMITAEAELPLYHYYKDYIMVMGYANRSLLETCLDYFTQRNDNLILATTPLHHTSWRDGIEKFVKPENTHVIDYNDSFNALGTFPDIEKCDLVIITHQFGQDFDLTGLKEFKEKTGALVMEDRVQGGTEEIRFSNPLVDITLYSMAMDKRPISLGGAFLYIRKNHQEIAERLIDMIANYPPEPIRKRWIDLLKKIPTFFMYNKRWATLLLLRSLKVLNLNLLDFTNMYRKKNPGFERGNFTWKPSKGLMKSMSQHYNDYRKMENIYEEKHMLFRNYLPDDIIQKYFPWYRDAALTPYNTIYVDKKHVQKFLKFMNRSEVCIIWNPTYKMFNFDYPGKDGKKLKEKHQKFHDGLVYLPCLVNMTRDEIHYLADRIVKFDQIVSKAK